MLRSKVPDEYRLGHKWTENGNDVNTELNRKSKCLVLKDMANIANLFM